MDFNNTDFSEQAGQAVSAVKALMGDQVLGIYLYGSAVLGGLRPDSDIDLLVLTSGRMADRVRAALTKELMALSGAAGSAGRRPLEVTVIDRGAVEPWQFPPRCEYMYGEWLRDGMEAGEVPQAGCDPDTAVLLWQARAHSVPLTGGPAAQLLPAIPYSDVRRAIQCSLPGLLSGIGGDERNVLLTLARMWFTLETGELCPKDAAAGWALPKLPRSLMPVMERAADGYLGKCADDWSGLEEAASRLAEFLRTEIEARAGRIVLITGAPGTGKTTTASILAERSALPQSVHLHTDGFYHSLRRGALPPHLPGSEAQNRTVMEAFLAAAERFARGGYDVIVDGVVGPWALEPWVELAQSGVEVHCIILRAGREETLARALGRDKLDREANRRLVEAMWGQFCDLGPYEAYAVDTTGCSVEETAAMVREAVAGGTHRLTAI